MAIAELTEEAFAATEAAEGPGKVRVAVHDASRLEWSLSVPLPEAGGPAPYSLRVEMRIPRNAFVRHVPWDQIQSFTRLDGPAITAGSDAVTIDALRRGALAMANQLARASDGFQRHCRLAASLFATAPHSELEDALTIWIEAAVRIAREARERLTRHDAAEPAELGRERKLVDEYVSVRLLEMLAGAERALSNVVESKSTHAARLAPVVADVEARLAEVLGEELAYREARGFTNADPSSPQALEWYLDRASRLKKHFQEVLFLEPETFKVAERAYHWIAAFVAVLASLWTFVWQVALINQQMTATTVSSGVVVLAILAGLVYAAKDRIKEIGRNWMTHRVHRVWGAQRITRYRAPRRRLASRDVVVTARESFHEGVATLPDPLNPECGASTAFTVLSYEHRGEVYANRQLVQSGVRRVKHVFRYDLSPLFARLDDATKPVPVLDEGSRRVRFIDAPRCYRFPVTVEVASGGQKHTERALLVVHKRGLERLERDDDGPPSLSDIGLEPG
ncbi:MAG TPA: hypothetical protein VM580_22270 [Labilithrix sp.]|nr:hypothetical protein [Labilithrix sp.]